MRSIIADSIHGLMYLSTIGWSSEKRDAVVLFDEDAPAVVDYLKNRKETFQFKSVRSEKTNKTIASFSSAKEFMSVWEADLEEEKASPMVGVKIEGGIMTVTKLPTLN